MVKKEHFDLIAVDYDLHSSRGVWGWLKTKELAAVLQTIRAEASPANVLDLGCGTGIYAKKIHSMFPDCEIVGIDKSPTMLQQFAKQGFSGNQVDLEQQSFSGGTFDVILSLGIFEFMQDLKFVRETIQKSAKTNTRFFVLVPRYNILNLFYFLYHLLKCNKVKFRGSHQYRNVFRDDGFDLKECMNVTPVSQLLVFQKLEVGAP